MDNYSTGGLMTKKWPYLLVGVVLSILFYLVLSIFNHSNRMDHAPNDTYPMPDLIFQSQTAEIESQRDENKVSEADSLHHQTALDSIQAWVQRMDKLNMETSQPSFWQNYGFMFRWLCVFMPIVIFLLIQWYHHEQKKSFILRAKRDSSAAKAVLEAPELPFLKSERFQSITKKLKQPNRTHGNGDQAYPPDAVQELHEPAYIVLIDRLSNSDHFAWLAEKVVKSMKQAGVKIDYFFYEEDPRHCYKAEVYNWVYLNDLRIKYSDHRLIIIGNGKGLIGANSENFVEWIELLFSWKERAILSTREPACWDEAEQLLNHEFILLPASLSGLAALADHFDDPARLDMKIWKNGFDESFKLDLTGEPNIAQLKSYLGEAGLDWLSACAVYPELSWPLTLQLGECACFSENLLTEERLLHLIRLDWFQKGSIPDNWREVLLEHLGSEKVICIREKLIEFLETKQIPNETDEPIQQKLNLAAQKWLMERDNSEYRHELRFAIQEAIKNEIGIDPFLVKNLKNRPGITALLPAFMKRWLFNQGISLLGMRSYVRAALAIVAAVFAFILIPTVQIPINLTLQHQHAIHGAMLNHAQDQILTWSEDRTAVVWDIKSGAPAKAIMQHDAPVRGANFSEDEDQILTWTVNEKQQGSVHLWNSATGELAFPPANFAAPVNWAEYSQNDSLILTFLQNGSLYCSKIQKNQMISQALAGDSITFSGAVFNRGKKQIIGWTDQKSIIVFNYKSGQQIGESFQLGYQVIKAEFFHDDSHLILWNADSTIRFWNLKTGLPVGAVLKHAAPISGISISPNQSMLLSFTSTPGSPNPMIYLWDLTTGKLKVAPQVHDESIKQVAFLFDHAKAITWTQNGSVQIWDIQNGLKPTSNFNITGGLQNVLLSPGTQYLLAWNENGDVFGWDIDTRTPIRPMLRLHYPVNGACLSPTHDAVMAWSQGGTAKFVQIAPFSADSIKKISVYPEMVPLGNHFINGKNPSANKQSKTIKKEYSPFVIGRYEITNLQFVQFLNESKASPDAVRNWLKTDPVLTKIYDTPSGQFIVEPGFEKYPVVGVNWFGANAYCEWLKEKTKIPFRLPTEAEMVYATASNLRNRSSLTTEQPENTGWFETNAASGPQPIGGKTPNVLGLYDLQGNLWEWCAENQTDDRTETGQTDKMIYGGAWNSNIVELEKTAWRNFVNPNPENNNSIGFRIAAGFSQIQTVDTTPGGDIQSKRVKNLTSKPESVESEQITKIIDVPIEKTTSPADAKLTTQPEKEPTTPNLVPKKEQRAEIAAGSKGNSRVAELPAPVNPKISEPAKRAAAKSNIDVGILKETNAAKQKSQSTGIDDIVNRKSDIAFDIKQQMPVEPANDKVKNIIGGRIGVQGSEKAAIGGKESVPAPGGSNTAPGRTGENISMTNSGSNGQNSTATETIGRDFNSIFPIIKRHETSINYCYERELKRNPNLKGKVVVRFTITPKGNVSDVSIVSTTLNNEQVEQCIVSRISRWNDFGEVDSSKGDATFRHVYVFGY